MASDDMNTAMYDTPLWIPPVERRDDLPTEGVEADTLCFVEEDCAVYRFEDGRWLVEAASGP